ncbi:hypothetical protein BDA96_09G056500 [Sorghum bicolor]|uniref:Uncharacterized protein n=2 Tax=Sorghum bicolor TaxID=4558 RepID=A0A921Q876_SORBI|nr:hypothetical protein BDA96_09G056500 [Sorghum bicolor]KXG21375.1 hypothetical protein SORBI_3009G053500 [Sorghum bicolor]
MEKTLYHLLFLSSCARFQHHWRFVRVSDHRGITGEATAGGYCAVDQAGRSRSLVESRTSSRQWTQLTEQRGGR